MVGSFTLHSHAIDSLYNRSRHRVDHPLVFILLRFQVPIGYRAAGMLSSKVLCLKCRADFLAGIAGIPLVHNISERSELIVAFKGVHAVIQGNQPSVVFPQHLHIGADLQIVTAETAHILHNDHGDSVGFDLVNHFLETRPVKPGAGDAIVGEVNTVGKTLLFRIVLQDALLV